MSNNGAKVLLKISMSSFKLVEIRRGQSVVINNARYIDFFSPQVCQDYLWTATQSLHYHKAVYVNLKCWCFQTNYLTSIEWSIIWKSFKRIRSLRQIHMLFMWIAIFVIKNPFTIQKIIIVIKFSSKSLYIFWGFASRLPYVSPLFNPLQMQNIFK